jgi:hypothetical protein
MSAAVSTAAPAPASSASSAAGPPAAGPSDSTEPTDATQSFNEILSAQRTEPAAPGRNQHHAGDERDEPPGARATPTKESRPSPPASAAGLGGPSNVVAQAPVSAALAASTAAEGSTTTAAATAASTPATGVDGVEASAGPESIRPATQSVADVAAEVDAAAAPPSPAKSPSRRPTPGRPAPLAPPSYPAMPGPTRRPNHLHLRRVWRRCPRRPMPWTWPHLS